MSTAVAAHGTLARARAGCPCAACIYTVTSTYHQTPRGVKPPIVRKFGKARVTIDPAADLDVLTLSSEQDGLVVRLSGVCNPETWDDLLGSDVNVDRARRAFSEAEDEVPTTKKVHVDPSRFRNGKGSTTINPGQDPRHELELPVLIAQMRVMATGLITGETDISVAMKQYGRLRDEIARRRREFAEAEGVFDVLQRAILAKAGVDE